MKTAKQILKPFIEVPFSHTRIVSDENALKAMEQYADQFRGVNPWIPTSEKVPPDYERVFYYDSREKGEICIGYFVWSQTPVDHVTHWKPLFSKP